VRKHGGSHPARNADAVFLAERLFLPNLDFRTCLSPPRRWVRRLDRPVLLRRVTFLLPKSAVLICKLGSFQLPSEGMIGSPQLHAFMIVGPAVREAKVLLAANTKGGRRRDKKAKLSDVELHETAQYLYEAKDERPYHSIWRLAPSDVR
jgi:hypothetical protein